MRRPHTRTGAVAIVAALAALPLAAPACAEGFRGRPLPYGSVYGGYGPAGGYGYGDALVRGSYVGAPLTRFPSPDRIVPSPWSYGTYGVPTVSGIPAAPAGQPTLTVINARGAKVQSRRGDAWAADDTPAGLRVIEVRVPRR